MVELISVVADGLAIVEAIAADQKSANPRLDRLDDEIVGALRKIYFTPDGVLSLLEKIANGEDVSVEEVERRLPQFNDRQWHVARALETLNFDKLSSRREVSLRRAEHLNQVRYGKVNIRADIQRLLNYPLTHNKRIKADKAAELLAKVRELNDQIGQLEEAHNFRARR
ncbi:hypothetical protein [Phenylobacterium sp.]|uniref:hypothetical protein n=1 Tax=Phenylobacterium sp. TaxID=1871053 RepID=UPI002FD92C2B